VDIKLPKANRLNNNIILFGEILADIFPERYVLGGAPFNVARHLQGFGLHPVLVSRTGDDALRQEIHTMMSVLGMDTQGLQTDAAHPTGQVLIHMENGGHRFEIVPEQAYDFIDADIADKTTHSVHPELVYFGTLAQRHPCSKKALSSLLANNPATRFLDINLRSPWYDLQTLEQSLQLADFLKLNTEELQNLCRLLHITAPNDNQLADSLIKDFDLQCILVTSGKDGAWLKNADGSLISAVSDKPVRILDTVGAGDGFSAIFILGLFCNWPLEQTLLRADVFARTICEIRGAIPLSDNFYEPFRMTWNLRSGDLK